MSTRRRLPRPVRKARKLKSGTVLISRAADRKVRELARDFGIAPEVVIGLFITFELSRMERGVPGGVGSPEKCFSLPVFGI